MLVGISGKKQSGKNTVATIWNTIDAERNYGLEALLEGRGSSSPNGSFTPKSFAQGVKEIASLYTGIPIELFEFEATKAMKVKYAEEKITIREVLQKVGTFGRKTFGESYWINKLFHDYKHQNWIITDVRYKNEADAIKQRGGILIRLNRNSTSTDTHDSEIELDDYSDWDYVINNNGSIGELAHSVTEIMIKQGIIKCM